MSKPGALAGAMAECLGEIDERFSGYRKKVVDSLLEIIKSQSTAAGKTGRIAETERVVNALAGSLSAKSENEVEGDVGNEAS